MLVLSTSTEYLLIPLTGPVSDLTAYPVKIALVPAGGGEPADGDYQAAQWIGGEAAILLSGFAPGEYMAYTRIQASPEDVRLAAGRVRIGDARM
jgi:hypothetical protein